MKQATQLGTATLALALGWQAAPAEACEPLPTVLHVAREVTKGGPLVLQVECGDSPCPQEAPAVTLVAPDGQRISGTSADYRVNPDWAFARWQPDVELVEGVEYTVVSDDDVVLAYAATTHVVASTAVFDPAGVVWGLQEARRDQGTQYCCGVIDSCGGQACFGELGKQTVGYAQATSNAPSTHAVRVHARGTYLDEVPWEAPTRTQLFVFDAPADELCVVLEVWDLVRDERREVEHCFAENIEGLGQLELAWNGLDGCADAPPVERPGDCFVDGENELGPDGLAGDGCHTPKALLEAWCEATSSELEVCAPTSAPVTMKPHASKGDPGGCSTAPGMRGSTAALFALTLLLLWLRKRRDELSRG